MFPTINFTETEAYKYLADHFISINEKNLKQLFEEDSARFEKFSLLFEDILVDYSKNRIDDTTIALLIQLARECKLDEAIKAMFSGEKINETEGRQVLHVALREPANGEIIVDGKNVVTDVHAVLAKMEKFTEGIISGNWKGYTGKAITDVVNIGIGGSDLGPVMVTEALKAYNNHLKLH
ncbi:MAG TPA: glucose-6-phosphate isomerase, partial [Pedobacter sp.]